MLSTCTLTLSQVYTHIQNFEKQTFNELIIGFIEEILKDNAFTETETYIYRHNLIALLFSNQATRTFGGPPKSCQHFTLLVHTEYLQSECLKQQVHIYRITCYK